MEAQQTSLQIQSAHSTWFPNSIGLSNIVYVKNIKYHLYLKEERRHYTYCLLCFKCFTSIISFNSHTVPMQHTLVSQFYRHNKSITEVK